MDDLKFYNFTMGTDSGIIEFDETKMYRKGEKTTPKNTCANPKDFKICIFTAFGCYFSLADEEWSNTEKSMRLCVQELK